MPRPRTDPALERVSPVERALRFAGLPFLILAMSSIFAFAVGRSVIQARAKPTPAPAVALAAAPCAITTLEALKATGLAPSRRFAFDGAIYGLHRGQAECTVSRGGALDRRRIAFCQFSNPGGLVIEKGNATYAFAPGPTRPATVWFEAGAPRCAADSDLNIIRRLKHLREHR